MNLITPEAWKSLPGPDDTTRVELPNGITLLSRSNFNSPSVVLTGYIACGSIFDPDDKLGLAYITAMALMRGTRGRSFQEIYEALESSAASFGFGASVHNTGFGGRALVEDLPLLLSLFSEALRGPLFPTEQVERLRAQCLTGLAIRAQDTADMASMTFDELIFHGHPYARPEDGFVETIQAITVEDIRAFHAEHYGPKGMVITVVGGVSAQQAIDMVQAAIGDWENPRQQPAPELTEATPVRESIRRHIPIPGKHQSDLVMGTLGPRRNSPDYLPASLGNSILGQFGMMGRIGEVVREQAGLAYNASASLNAMIATGSWEVEAGVNPNNLQRAIDLIRSELTRFTAEPVTAEELQDNQANYIGRLPLSLESNGGVANALIKQERFQLGLDYYRRYPDLIMQVTPEQVLETARKYLRVEHLVTVSAGPEID